MRLNPCIFILMVLIFSINGQEQFKTGNTWNYYYTYVIGEGSGLCGPGERSAGGISIKIISAIPNVGGSINFSAEIKDTFDNFIDTGNYLYENDSVSSIKHTSPDSSLANGYIEYLIVPNGLIDTVGYYIFSNTHYAILEENPTYPTYPHYLFLRNIGLLIMYSSGRFSSCHGSDIDFSSSHSLIAFNNIPINSDSLFQYFQSPIKNNFKNNQSVSSPLLSIKKDGSKIIYQSVQFVDMARIEIIDLQGRKLISRDLVFTHDNETASFSINQLPEGLYIVNAYERGSSQKIASMKIIR